MNKPKNEGERGFDGELAHGKWTPRDGSDFHKMMRHEADWRYQRDDCQYDVECEWGMGLYDSNGHPVGYGFADLIIDDKHVIDYKTDQMTSWNATIARARGHEYGSKIASYANSPLLADNAKGHLYMVGNRNRDARIEATFREAAGEHGVNVVFCDSGDPQTVMDQIEDHFMPLEKQKDRENNLTEMVSRSQETNQTRSYLNEVQLNTYDAILTIKSELNQKLEQTYAAVEKEWEVFDTPSAPSANSGISSFVLAPLLFKAFEERAKNSDIGQWVSEHIEEWQANRHMGIGKDNEL